MKWSLLIADSGGTKTDWCLVDQTGKRELFTTESYHPRFIDDAFIYRQAAFWKKRQLDGVALRFYGSGCFKAEAAIGMVAVLQQIGFRNVEVHSDMLAAALALNKGNGWGAICGTGSVVFRSEHQKIMEHRGGMGHQRGDEGSGYYFGRLFMDQLKDNSVLMNYYEQAVAGKTDVDLIGLAPDSDQAKAGYALLPALLARYKHDTAIKNLHEQNVRQFAELYTKGCTAIGLCGSYAFYHEQLFRSVLGEYGILVEAVMERPIQSLTDYLVATTGY